MDEALHSNRWRWLDLLGLVGLLVVAAILRFVDLPTRGTWDADQGHDMLTLLRFVQDGVWPLLGPPTSIGDFHHGALYYYILAPAAWLSGSNPIAVAGEIALLGVAAVGLVWWIARSVAGSVAWSGAGSVAASVAGLVAGLTTALVAATSSSAIDESTFIWNPNLIAFSSALTVAAAWRAWTTRRPRWWLLAAVGLAITMQSHVLGWSFVVPVGGLLLADAWRRPRGERRPVILAGIGGVVVIVASYLPLIVYELGNDFAETRGAIAFLTGGGQSVALDPVSRLLFVGLRILSWPLTGLITDAPVVGVVAAVGVLAILAWRVRGARGLERTFAWWLALSLSWCWLVLGLGVAGLATVTPLPVDHYHAFLDPLVFVVVGLGVWALWNAAAPADGRSDGEQAVGRSIGPVVGRWSVGGRSVVGRSSLGPAVGIVVVGGLVAWNATIWPPAVTADGGWPAAQAAGTRIESAAGPGPVAFVSLPEFKSPEAYTFPLVHDGRRVVEPPAADTLVIVCDALFVDDCGGPAEDAAVAGIALAGGRVPVLVDRFDAAPGRTISVYRGS